jgi:RNA polymerase sigma-70 factor (ECF subfamily)
MTDAELIASTLQGDRDAFTQLAIRYQGMVKGQAWHALRNWADAADVTQRVLIHAYMQLDSLRSPERFGGWLRRITINECAMWHRSRREHVPIEEAPESSLAAPGTEQEESGDNEQLLDAISRLPESGRLVVTLFYLNGMSCVDVGRFLGISANTVKVRLHRARKQLKREMMNMVERTLQERQPTVESAEACGLAVPVQVVETYEQTAAVKPGEMVLIYTDDARVTVTATDSDRIRVRARKVLFGKTEEEARAVSARLPVGVKRLRNLSVNAPQTGERVAGVGVPGDPHGTNYSSADQQWLGFVRNWPGHEYMSDSRFRERIDGDVVAITAAGNRLGTISVPISFGESENAFRVIESNGTEGFAVGPAGTVSLEIEVPRHVPLFAYAAFQMDLRVSGLAQDLYVAGACGSFRAQDMGGHVFACNTAPAQLNGIAGDVRVIDFNDQRGVQWGDGVVRRFGKPPSCKIRDVQGDCRITCRMLTLDLRRIAGSIDVRNDHGRTALCHTEAWPEGKTAEIASSSGNISLQLSEEADIAARAGVWTQCGTIDRSRWPANKGGNNPEMTFLSTTPEGDEHHIRIRTDTGKVKVVRECSSPAD